MWFCTAIASSTACWFFTSCRQMIHHLQSFCKPWGAHWQISSTSWEGFSEKIIRRLGELMHYKWTVVLILVWCRQKGAAMSPMAVLVAITAYPSRPLGHLRLMISFLLSEFFSLTQGSALCSQISGVFYCARILFKCLYSPKPKSSNYPRKKAFVNMPIKMNLSYRGIILKYAGCTYPWVE